MAALRNDAGPHVDDTVPDTVDDQPDTGETLTAEQVARNRVLQREAQEVAGDPEDRGEVAELRTLLGEPWADLPA